jgi:hypothetical protein
VAEEDIATLAERDGWTIKGPVATFEPVKGGWSAVVRQAVIVERAAERWHVASRNPRSVAAYAFNYSQLNDARLTAERQVRARNGTP